MEKLNCPFPPKTLLPTAALPVCKPHCPKFRLQKVIPVRTSAVVAPFVLSGAGALAITSSKVCIVPTVGPLIGSVNPVILLVAAPVSRRLYICSSVSIWLPASEGPPLGFRLPANTKVVDVSSTPITTPFNRVFIRMFHLL
jgi:hypothetical protein